MSFHKFRINEVYSNADGTVQYIEFFGLANGQNIWGPQSIVSTNGEDTNTFNIPSNLPSAATQGKFVLVATQGFANLGLVTPDYIVPSGFLFNNGGSVDVPGMEGAPMSWGSLPDNGTQSLSHTLDIVTNSPRNFAGVSVTMPGNPIVGTDEGESIIGTVGADFILGRDGNDTLNGGQGNDTLLGEAGNDLLNGGDHNDTMDGGVGDDTMVGGTGNDVYIRNAAGDVVNEDLDHGTDLVKSAVTYTLAPNIEKMTLTGSGAINGTGNELANTLTGNGAKNTLKGLEGDDILKGLKGADVLTGGAGADKFDFDAVADSGIGSTKRDKITDFKASELDKIDLSTIDAKPLAAGDQAFKFIGGAAFSGTNATGQLRFDAANHLLLGSTDADSTAEFSILVTGINGMTGSNFIL